MIDIWLLCGLTIPFFIFILEVTSEMIRHKKKQQLRKRTGFANGLHPLIPNKVKDQLYKQKQSHEQEQEKDQHDYIRNISSFHGEVSLTNNGGTNQAFKVDRGTQTDKKDYKKPKISATPSNDDTDIRFTLLQAILLTYKTVAIQLMTVAFIFVYMVAAVRNYVY